MELITDLFQGILVSQEAPEWVSVGQVKDCDELRAGIHQEVCLLPAVLAVAVEIVFDQEDDHRQGSFSMNRLAVNLQDLAPAVFQLVILLSFPPKLPVSVNLVTHRGENVSGRGTFTFDATLVFIF